MYFKGSLCLFAQRAAFAQLAQKEFRDANAKFLSKRRQLQEQRISGFLLMWLHSVSWFLHGSSGKGWAQNGSRAKGMVELATHSPSFVTPASKFTICPTQVSLHSFFTVGVAGGINVSMYIYILLYMHIHVYVMVCCVIYGVAFMYVFNVYGECNNNVAQCNVK